MRTALEVARAVRAIERATTTTETMEADDARATRRRRKLAQAIGTTRAGLEALARDGTLAEVRAEAYAATVTRAEARVRRERAVETGTRGDATTTATTTGATTTTTTTTTTSVASTRLAASGRPIRASVKTPRETPRETPASTVAARPRAKALTTEDEGELRRQRVIQDGLTDEMSELARGLKANALALERGLGRSTTALEDAETKLSRNVDGARASVRRQTAAYRANRRGSCWTWIILALIGVLFAWTYVVIKVSSDRTKRVRA